MKTKFKLKFAVHFRVDNGPSRSAWIEAENSCDAWDAAIDALKELYGTGAKLLSVKEWEGD